MVLTIFFCSNLLDERAIAHQDGAVPSKWEMMRFNENDSATPGALPNHRRQGGRDGIACEAIR